MMVHRETLVATFVGALLLASVAAAQAPVTKFVQPLKGQVDVEILDPQSAWEGNVLVTKIKVKNVSKGPIAGFKVDQYYYNKQGDAVTGSPSFRHPKPFMPGDVLDVVLRVPRHPQMANSQFLFSHQNGTVKPKRVPKFTP